MSSANRWMPRSNGPSCRSVCVSAARQAAIAHPTVRGVLGAIRLDALSDRSWQQRRVHERGEEGAERAGQRVRAALDAAVRVEQPRGVQRVRGLVGACGRAAGAHRRRRSMSGFSRIVTSSVTLLRGRRCSRRRSPGCRGARSPPRRVRARAPRRRRRGRCRRRSAAVSGLERVEQRCELGPDSCSTITAANAHGEASAASKRAAESRTSNASSARRRAVAGAAASARTARSAAAAARRRRAGRGGRRRR